MLTLLTINSNNKNSNILLNNWQRHYSLRLNDLPILVYYVILEWCLSCKTYQTCSFLFISLTSYLTYKKWSICKLSLFLWSTKLIYRNLECRISYTNKKLETNIWTLSNIFLVICYFQYLGFLYINIRYFIQAFNFVYNSYIFYLQISLNVPGESLKVTTDEDRWSESLG